MPFKEIPSIKFSLTVFNLSLSADSFPIVYKHLHPFILHTAFLVMEHPSSLCPRLSHSLLSHDSSLSTLQVPFLAYFSNHCNLTSEPSPQNSTARTLAGAFNYPAFYIQWTLFCRCYLTSLWQSHCWPHSSHLGLPPVILTKLLLSALDLLFLLTLLHIGVGIPSHFILTSSVFTLLTVFSVKESQHSSTILTSVVWKCK